MSSSGNIRGSIGNLAQRLFKGVSLSQLEPASDQVLHEYEEACFRHVFNDLASESNDKKLITQGKFLVSSCLSH